MYVRVSIRRDTRENKRRRGAAKVAARALHTKVEHPRLNPSWYMFCVASSHMPGFSKRTSRDLEEAKLIRYLHTVTNETKPRERRHFQESPPG